MLTDRRLVVMTELLIFLVAVVSIFLFIRNDTSPEEKTCEPPQSKPETEPVDHSSQQSKALSLFAHNVNQLAIDAELKKTVIQLHDRFHEWDGTDFEEQARKVFSRFASYLNNYLPPKQMLKLGGKKKISQYESESIEAEPWEKWMENMSGNDWAIRDKARYGSGTKFTNAFRELPVTLRIPDAIRTQGHMIIAPPGHGKTTCMEQMILDDAASGSSVIVLDSQEGMIDRLLHFLPEERVVYLDGSALEYPLALSAFNIGRTDRVADEIKVSRALDLFENMFSSMDFAFTTKQSTLFRELCRFLTSIPDSGVSTAIDILRNGYVPYEHYLSNVSDSTEVFVRSNLGPPKRGQSEYGQTRGEVANRFDAVSSVPAILRMFSAPTRKINIAAELDSKKVILINTAQSTLSPTGASLLGRYFLMQIALEVLARPETNDNRIYFYIDEAQEYFSTSGLLSLLMEQGRKRGLCLVMAFHHLGQLKSEGLADAVRSLTAIKSIKASSAKDANALAGDTQIDPKELLNVQKYHFAVHCRGIGHGVFNIPDTSHKKPVRTASDVLEIKRAMHERYSYVPTAPKTSQADTIDPDAPQSLD